MFPVDSGRSVKSRVMINEPHSLNTFISTATYYSDNMTVLIAYCPLTLINSIKAILILNYIETILISLWSFSIQSLNNMCEFQYNLLMNW